MANQNPTDGVENGEEIDNEVDSSKELDETLNKTDQDNETDAGDEQEEEKSEDGDETKEETKAEFKKRFTQLKGETPEEYLKNLEDAYANSSTEGQRNAQRAKEAEEKFQKVAHLVATDPEFAKQLSDATSEEAPKPIVDPALEYAREQMNKKYSEDYAAFVDIHPEMATDKTLYDEVIAELDVIAAANEARGNRLSMAEGLRRAWISLGKDASDKKDELVNKAKENASASSASGKPKSTEKVATFTPEQIAMAEKMGLTVKDLAKYNK